MSRILDVMPKADNKKIDLATVTELHVKNISPLNAAESLIRGVKEHNPSKSEKNNSKEQELIWPHLASDFFYVITTMECVTLPAPSNEVQKLTLYAVNKGRMTFSVYRCCSFHSMLMLRCELMFHFLFTATTTSSLLNLVWITLNCILLANCCSLISKWQFS